MNVVHRLLQEDAVRNLLNPAQQGGYYNKYLKYSNKLYK
jgi:hypothetical protein